MSQCCPEGAIIYYFLLSQSSLLFPREIWKKFFPVWQIRMRDGTTEWGWGVVVNVVKNPSIPPNMLPSHILGSRTSSYIVDTLLHCAFGLTSDGLRPKPCPALTRKKGEMHVVIWILEL